jgi:hypothetical protein
MSNFFTRPRFQDRDVVQLSGDTISLSGETNIDNIFRFKPNAVAGYVLTALDTDGTVYWAPNMSADTNTFVTGGTLSGTNLILNYNNGGTTSPIDLSELTFSGGSGNCITDLYVSNIHSCSPLNINPLDEGNVYFGSTSGVTIDVTNSRLGIGTETPQYPLEIVGSNSRFYYDPISVGGLTILSGNTGIPRYGIIIPSYLSKPQTGGSVGIRSWSDITYPGYGKVGDMFVYAGDATNGLNIINQGPGTNTEDYIRFYAGTQANISTADIHIQGTGSTRGYVGINTETPTERLDVNGKTKTTQLQVTTSPVNGYVLTSDASGNATWKPSSGSSGTFTGNTSASCITDLWVTNIHGCSPITVWDNLQTVGSNANGLGSTALGIANTSDGVGSSAFGGGTTAFGSASFSEGYQTLALGDSSHAEGYQTIAGYKALTATSVVAGVVTISDNVDYSSEFTSGTVLLNNQFYTYTGTSYSAPNFFINLSNFSVTIPLVSVAVVDYNNFNSPLAYISEGDHSHAEGILTRALGPASHAEGQFTNSMGKVSHAEGELTSAYGTYSHAEGYQTVAYGGASHSEGNSTYAFGGDSHAEGLATTAYGNFSHAQGVGTSAIGDGSHAEGYVTNAYGLYSHAGGSGSTVSGITSFIHSTDSLLTGNRSVLLGGLNLTGTTDDTVYVPNIVVVTSFTPSGSTDPTGENGSISWDNNYLYWKSGGQWLRISGSTW